MVAQFRQFRPKPDANIPPQNIEIEESILGGCLLDPEAYPRLKALSRKLEPEAFYVSAHKLIYQAIQTLGDKNHSTDLMSVCAYLSDRGELDKIGGTAKLAQLLDRTVTAANIDRYAELLIDKYLRRTLGEIGQNLTTLAYNTYLDLTYVCNEVKNLVMPVIEPIVANKSEEDYSYSCIVSRIKEIITKERHTGLRMFKLANLAKETGYTVRALKSLFFADLAAEQNEPLMTFKELMAKYGHDTQKWVIQGVLPRASLTEIFALPGDGKTLLSYDLICSALIGQPWNGFPVANKRLKAVVIQTDEAAQATIETLRDRFEDHNIDCHFKTYWTIDQLFSLKEELEEIQPDILLIDSLTSINRGSSKSENDADYAMDIYALRQMCGELGLAGILIHHSNKLGDSRGSTGIPGAVDQVFNLRRPPDVNDVSDPRRQLEIKKSRFRMPMTYNLELNDDKTWTVTGKVGASLTLDGTAPDKIVAFLSGNRGTVYSNRELEELLNISYETVRRSTKELQRERLIEQCRGQGSKAKLYYIPDDNTPNGYILKIKQATEKHTRETHTAKNGETHTARSHNLITSKPLPEADIERNTQKHTQNDGDFEPESEKKSDQMCVSPETPSTTELGCDQPSDQNAIASDECVFLPECDRLSQDWPLGSWVRVTVPKGDRRGTYTGRIDNYTPKGRLLLAIDNNRSLAANPEWCERIEVARDRAGAILTDGDTVFYAGDDLNFKRATENGILPLIVKRIIGDRAVVGHKQWGSMNFERPATDFVK